MNSLVFIFLLGGNLKRFEKRREQKYQAQGGKDLTIKFLRNKTKYMLCLFNLFSKTILIHLSPLK